MPMTTIKTPRWLCTVMALVLALTGPLALLLLAPAPAAAQQYPQPVSGEQTDSRLEPTTGQKVGAGFMNVFYVPGKVILCGLGTVTATALLAVTFGSGYRPAARVFDEGCGGDWVITGEHLSGKIPPREDIE